MAPHPLVTFRHGELPSASAPLSYFEWLARTLVAARCEVVVSMQGALFLPPPADVHPKAGAPA